MNAGSTREIERKQLLNALQSFREKLEKKSVGKEEIKSVVNLLKSQQITSTQVSPTISKESNQEENSKIFHVIQGLLSALGQNKALIEKAAAGVPFTELDELRNSLERFVKENEALKSQVTRKEKAPGA